jgi:hypothetical protein
MAEFYQYIPVAVSQTDQVLGVAGTPKGDILQRLVISVATAATSTVSIKDGGGSAIVITAANTPIGVYPVTLELISTGGPWKITTGAGVTVLAIGRFSS